MRTDTEMLALCQKIHTLRVQNHLSQKEMADKLGISIASLQKIEQNCPPPQLRCNVLLRVHTEFGIKFADIFTAD